jgi:hypothetical protein
MNDLGKFVARKCLEKASIAVIKKAVMNDSSLSDSQKIALVNGLNVISMASDIKDIMKILRR